MESLYYKYGGFAAVSKIVHCFYDKVLRSELLSPYFDGIEMQKLMDHQSIFFSSILGGPLQYEGPSLKKAHQHLNITEEAFAETATLLQEALEDTGVETADIETIMSVVAGTKSDIVSGGE